MMLLIVWVGCWVLGPCPAQLAAGTHSLVHAKVTTTTTVLSLNANKKFKASQAKQIWPTRGQSHLTDSAGRPVLAVVWISLVW